MSHRKEWKSLYMVNKSIYFLGFKPVQLILVCSVLFLVGYMAWWLAILLIPFVYAFGKKLSRKQNGGDPNYLLSLVISQTMPKYFEDSTTLFDQLIIK